MTVLNRSIRVIQIGLGDEFEADVHGPADEPEDRYREEMGADLGAPALLEEYRQWRARLKEDHVLPEPDGLYTWANAAVPREVSGEELYDFCRAMNLEEKDGLFVSAAIHAVPEDRVELPDMAGVDYLGKEVGKQVVIDGNAGDHVGRELDGGYISVSGDVGDLTGYRMQDGRLEVEGSAGINTGAMMEAGTIEIGGVSSLGNRMDGGELYIGEEFDPSGSAGDATVYVKRDGEYVQIELPEPEEDDRPGSAGGLDTWKDVW